MNTVSRSSPRNPEKWKMSGTYYAAVEGDPLTSGEGSRVYARDNAGTIEDGSGRPRRMAFIGDDAYCARCKSTGSITYGVNIRNGGRMLDLVNGGRYQAVGGDIVLCKCADHPRIIATYGTSWSIVDRGEDSRVAVTKAPAQNLTYDEQVSASVPCVSLEGYPYLIETADGKTVCGRIDSSNRLPRIYTDTAATYTIHWGDEALAHEEWQ